MSSSQSFGRSLVLRLDIFAAVDVAASGIKEANPKGTREQTWPIFKNQKRKEITLPRALRPFSLFLVIVLGWESLAEQEA
jgi:hypothetical protein